MQSPGAADCRATVRTKGRGDIQGLRTLAVLAAVLYHGGVPGLSGGFVGVDCFFIVSGYLITGPLVAEAARQGRVSFSTFYARRARRILPAAVLVLSATVLASVALLAPLQARQVVRDCLVARPVSGKLCWQPAAAISTLLRGYAARVYRDDNHLTTSYTQWLQPVLQPAIDAALAGQRVD